MGLSVRELCECFDACDRISEAAAVLKEIGEKIDLPYPAVIADYTSDTLAKDENGEPLAKHFGWEIDFREDWEERRLHLISPIAAMCRLSLKPFVWKAEDVERACNELPRAADWHLTPDRGIYGALAVPIHMPMCRVGSVQWISRDVSIDLPAVLAKYGADLRAAAHLFMELVYDERTDTEISIHGEHPVEKGLTELNRMRLTERELECLNWVALGKTDVQIGEIIHRVATTSRFHVENAMTKLGASNRAQAVAIAMQLGLIRAHDNIHPLDMAQRQAERC
ncbi:MAG: LuxR C-terminal-related transcriptional regulator [Gammaproteobacteria bacterium]|nr:LuxR C-terminal-related transcriptional regulator [Gammaproteobacteria bacterium]MCY4200416.1 LuxR C-terminal-related transcriptional regulator [Gammaproteobacteria bacterium]MCY4278603.1 LuxR C-terminal-related transcriptional regulator [Gammaproteobacteria bacterium]